MRKPLVFVALVVLSVAFIAGCEGPPGPAGDPGPPGISGYEVVVGETAVDPSTPKQLQVDCPDGKKALGAGWSVLDPTNARLFAQANYFQVAFDGSHWVIHAQNKSASAPDWKVRVRVVCASVGP